MSSSEDNTTPGKQPEANEADASTPENGGSPQEAAKPKFKVTRSPFAPKVGDEKPSAMPKPAPKPAEEPAANAPVPFPTKPEEAQKPAPVAKEAPAPKPVPTPAKPVGAAPSPVGPKKPFPSAPPKPAAVSSPVGGAKPKPMAPLTARKAAEAEAVEESKVNPLALATDVIAAAVALTFAVLIVLSLK